MKVFLPALLLLFLAVPLLANDNERHPSSHVMNDANQLQQLRRALKQAQVPSAATGNGIDYHGGPVMSNTVTIYYIWYGNWNGNNGVTVLESFAKNLGGSPYFNINTTYTDGNGSAVKNNLIFGGSTIDNYSLGKNLTDSQVWQAVSAAIDSGRLPSDPNAVYFLLTSADVTATSGFCTQYCGWHTYNVLNKTPIKYAFVGDGSRCPSGCTAQPANSPNGNVGADGMASVIAHELSETVSNPQLNAWWRGSTGEENGDICAWTFGVTFAAPNGSRANMSLGGDNYLIQQMWVNSSGGSCQMQHIVPGLSAINPAAGTAGSSVAVTLTGTNFAPGMNLAISGEGVNASNLTVVSATEITATLSIAAGADAGTHSVTVTSGAAVSSAVTIQVDPALFTLIGVSPSIGPAGTAVPITLTGTNFAGIPAINVSGLGVSVGNVKVVTANMITASLLIDKAAAAGARSLTLTVGSISSAPLPFKVTSTAITLTGITPFSSPIGSTVQVVLTGTNFTAASSVSVSGIGITVNGVAVVSSTQMTASIAVAATAAVGTRNVTAVSGSNVTSPLPFTVTPAAAVTVVSVNPATAGAGSTVNVTLTGTQFAKGASVAVSGTGVTVTSVTVVSSTQLTAQFAISANAAIGPRNVSVGATSVTTRAGIAGRPSVKASLTFTIAPVPVLTSITPNSAVAGSTTRVTLTGSNFLGASIVAVSGGGVSLNAVTVVNTTHITANLVVDAAAASGPHDVTVTLGAIASARLAFIVTAPPMTVTSVSPSNSAAGSALSVTLTGTRFAAGATVAVSGTGVIVSGLTVVSATQITAQFAITSAAAPGVRNVTVSVGTAATVIPATFTINAVVPNPVLTRLDKVTAFAGSTTSLTATGANFTSDNKLSVSGTGVTISNQQLQSGTQMTASLTIDASAPTGIRNVMVSYGNTATAPLIFTITAAIPRPSVTSVTPPNGVLGSALVMTVDGSGFTRNSTIAVDSDSIPVLQTTFVKSTQITVVLGLSGPIGRHSFTVSNPGSPSPSNSAPVSFSITAPPPPAASSVIPAFAALTQTIGVTVRGANFTPDVRVTVSGTGITLGNITSAGPNFVIVALTVASNAAVGEHTLTVTTSGGTSNTVTFTVIAN